MISMIEIIAGISGSIIALLLGIIGYFLKQLHQSVNILDSSVHVLLTTVEVDKVRHENLVEKVDNHEERICTLEKK